MEAPVEMLPPEAEPGNSLFGIESSLSRAQGKQPRAFLCLSRERNSLWMSLPPDRRGAASVPYLHFLIYVLSLPGVIPQRQPFLLVMNTPWVVFIVMGKQDTSLGTREPGGSLGFDPGDCGRPCWTEGALVGQAVVPGEELCNREFLERLSGQGTTLLGP